MEKKVRFAPLVSIDKSSDLEPRVVVVVEAVAGASRKKSWLIFTTYLTTQKAGVTAFYVT